MGERQHNGRNFFFLSAAKLHSLDGLQNRHSFMTPWTKQINTFPALAGSDMFVPSGFIRFSMVNWDNSQFCCCGYRRGRTPSQTKQHTSTPLCWLTIKEIIIKHHQRNMFFFPTNCLLYWVEGFSSEIYILFFPPPNASHFRYSQFLHRKDACDSTLYWND